MGLGAMACVPYVGRCRRRMRRRCQRGHVHRPEVNGWVMGVGRVLQACDRVTDPCGQFPQLVGFFGCHLPDLVGRVRFVGGVRRGQPGGFVQFSVLHPVISAPVGRWVNDESGARHARTVGDYFYQGPLTETWAFSAAPAQLRDRFPPFTITYARRTLTGWLSAILGAGLVIEAIAEPCADEQTATAYPQVADTRIAPYFLIVRARKP